jgi:dynein light intermediate chain 1
LGSSVGAGLPGTGGGPASQNEVLANFFQSLLSKKTTGVPGAPAGRAPSLAGRSSSVTGQAMSLGGGGSSMGSTGAGSPGQSGPGSMSPTNRQT